MKSVLLQQAFVLLRVPYYQTNNNVSPLYVIQQIQSHLDVTILDLTIFS